MLELMSLLALIISPQTCQKSLTIPALPSLLQPLSSGSWREQWGSISIHLILRPNKSISSHLSWHIWCPRIPSTSSVPVHCVPKHQSMMLHTLSSSEDRIFCYLPLAGRATFRSQSTSPMFPCAQNHLQALCCKHKVRPLLMKDDFLQYLQDHMNSAGYQPANLSLLHRNITWLAATSLPNKLHLQLSPMISHLANLAQGTASPCRVLFPGTPEQCYSLVLVIFLTLLVRQHIFYLFFNQISTIYFPRSTDFETNNSSAVLSDAHSVHHKMWGLQLLQFQNPWHSKIKVVQWGSHYTRLLHTTNIKTLWKTLPTSVSVHHLHLHCYYVKSMHQMYPSCNFHYVIK